MNTSIISTIKSTAKTTGLLLKKHSPEILVTIGAIGTIVSAVMACKATTKLEQVLEEHKDNIKLTREVIEKNEFGTDKYTKEDAQKDLAIFYGRAGVAVVKLYAPSVILGALSLTAMITSNNILRKRNIALTAAYAAVDKAYKAYRGNVIEEFGEDVNKRMKLGLKKKIVEETKINEETGELTTEKKEVIDSPSSLSPYSQIFDEYNKYFKKDAEYNRFFLESRQRMLTQRLCANGFLFLNDVYKELGFEPTKAGQVVGWVYGKGGDDYVDFHLWDTVNPATHAFIEGKEASVLLDFNVQGTILDKVDWESISRNGYYE